MNSQRFFQESGRVRCVLGSALLGALTGCVGYVEQPRAPQVYYERQPRPREVYVAPPAVEVSFAIRTESDFYEPLSPYGRWEVVGAYGRCWIPGRVEADWRPYGNGSWQRTDAGWYWASDEPWGWATYHYGRWNLSAELGWYWVPQTVWAPAWVSWHSGGGYVGWAPLHPSVRIAASGSIDVNVRVIAPQAFVFVEERRFLEPVRPATVVVNNTTIVNNTVNITNIKVVNNTVINEGPRTQVIEQVSGRKIQSVPVRELRRKQEAEVVARQRITPTAGEKMVPTPVRGAADPRGQNPQLDSERRANEVKAKAQEQSQKNARELELKAAQVDSKRRANEAKVKAQEQSQKNARELELKAAQVNSERRANEAKVKAQEQSQKNARELAKKAAQADSERRAKDVEKRAQPGSKGRGKAQPAAVEKDGTNTVDGVQTKKVKE